MSGTNFAKVPDTFDLCLNDSIGWESGEEKLVKSLFHEISHHYKTEDVDDSGLLHNAHNLEIIMDGLSGTGIRYSLQRESYNAAQPSPTLTEVVYHYFGALMESYSFP
ncbi:MAG: hypothetical protein SFV81_29540 [Pirellulaceae bacterium]|nr:hypothetical protein [Pirellulaceae bacterium]